MNKKLRNYVIDRLFLIVSHGKCMYFVTDNNIKIKCC